MEESVTIRYRRPPDRVQLFRQTVVARTPEYTVTYLPGAELPRPVSAGGRVILEPGAPVVWFTYPSLWHDIGRFHLLSGEFTGCYANVLTPVRMGEEEWETTDLFLDVWVPERGEPALLDENELEEALREGWLDATTADTAKAHARALLAAAREGSWPPPHVDYWTLSRVHQRLGYSSAPSTAADTRRFRST